MKTRNASMKLISMVIAVVIATAVWTVCGATSVSAGFDSFRSTGMFGVARGQTARINAVDPTNPNRTPIQVEMMFIDTMGNVVARSERREVSPGQASFFDVPFDSFFPTETIRVELRAVVIVSSQGGSTKGKDVLITGEVFDNDTGKTTWWSDSFEECACGTQ